MKRYRLMLSDGQSTFSCESSHLARTSRKSCLRMHLACMLGTQMNQLIDRNSLKENSIIRIDRVMTNAIDKQSGR